ncbi:MAG TPA: type II toxin-antitoxin system VapB family antitoxin [Polyangia bacterium]|nr:type II toxin-antitoxin system VapB family antitoxin [Polyangia bacterium]
MHTVRMTLNVNEELLAEVVEAHPGVTKTALVEQGLRALLARQAARRLAEAGGTGKAAQRAKRSAWARR